MTVGTDVRAVRALSTHNRALCHGSFWVPNTAQCDLFSIDARQSILKDSPRDPRPSRSGQRSATTLGECHHSEGSSYADGAHRGNARSSPRRYHSVVASQRVRRNADGADSRGSWCQPWSTTPSLSNTRQVDGGRDQGCLRARAQSLPADGGEFGSRFPDGGLASHDVGGFEQALWIGRARDIAVIPQRPRLGRVGCTYAGRDRAPFTLVRSGALRGRGRGANTRLDAAACLGCTRPLYCTGSHAETRRYRSLHRGASATDRGRRCVKRRRSAQVWTCLAQDLSRIAAVSRRSSVYLVGMLATFCRVLGVEHRQVELQP